IAAENPGSPVNSSLIFTIFGPDGTQLSTFGTDSVGRGQSSVLALTGGTYYVRVSYNNAYEGEYRFRATVAAPGVQLESEGNDSPASATPLALTTVGNNKSGSGAGYVKTTSDLDYFNLGNIAAGQTIFLSTRKPASSNLDPVVAIYNSS